MYLYFILHFCFSLIFFTLGRSEVLLNFPLLSLGSLLISFVLVFDKISSLFILFIRLIAGVVLCYSRLYMGSDLTPKRFIVLVNIFVLSIFLLVISPSLLRIILGWDGLGVISFLLVMYYQNSSSLKSSLITVYTNRFGDVAILLSLAIIYEVGF